MVFNANENRIGAFAGFVALVLVLALTVMAFTALEPGPEASVNWEVSMPEPPQPGIAPTF